MSRILLRDLQPGRLYRVQVRSRAGDAVSDWSQLVDVQTTYDTVAPSAPSGLSWTVVGTAFKATWNAPTVNDDGSAIADFRDYQVTLFSPADPTNKAVFYTNATRFDFPFEANVNAFGTPRASVTIEVRSRDHTGNVSLSPVTATVTNPAPSNVTGLVATAGYDVISLSWNAVSDTDLKEYHVYYGTTLDGATTRVFTGTATSFSHALTTYTTDAYYKVYAADVFNTESVAAATAGPVRPKSSFAVDTTAPSIPTNLAATLTNTTDGKSANAAVLWTAVTDTDNDLSEYIVGYKPSAATDWQYISVDYTLTSVRVDNLLPYTNYDFRIRSRDWTRNASAWSATVTKTAAANAAPATVTGVAVSAGKDSITVNWTANTEADVINGAGIYLVDIATNSGFTTGLLSYRTGESSISINGLATGTTYYARVKAVDSLGLASASWSTSASATTGTLPTQFTYTVSATAPVSPKTGDIWMDTTSGFEKQWSGSAWANTGNVSTSYIASRGTDLVTNGTGAMGNNYNFSGWAFDATDAPVGAAGSFNTSPAGVATIKNADELLPVDPNKKFKFSFQAKQKGTTAAGYLYSGVQPFDAYKQAMSPYNTMYISGTLTTLAVALNPGDTTVTINTPSTPWYGSAGKPAFGNTHWRSIIWWDYTDPGGKLWGPETYSRNWSGADYWADGGITGNVITLKAPYSGPVRPVGTKLSNGSSGGTYMYGGTVNTVVPATWTQYSATITGIATGGIGPSFSDGWPIGVGFAKLVWLTDRTSAGASDTLSKHSVALVSFSDAAGALDSANTAIASANGKNKIVFSLSAPSSTTGYIDGDTWFQKDASNVITGQWEFSAGAWVAKTIGSQVIANLDAGKLTANSAFINTLNVGAGGAIQSAGYTSGGTSGFQLSTSGLIIKGSGNTVDAGVLKGGTITGTTINVGAGGILNVDSTAYIKSNNYSAGSTGYSLGSSGLEVNDGTIDAKTLKTGSAVIGDLVIGRSADALGSIASYGYTPGVSGFRLDKSGLEINNGSIAAGALKIQDSDNILTADVSGFEFVPAYYTTSVISTISAGGTSAVVSIDTTNAKFGTQSAKFVRTGVGSYSDLVLASSNTDYRYPVEPNTDYIISAWVMTPAASGDKSVSFVWRGLSGAVEVGGSTVVADGTWQRIYATFNSTTNSNMVFSVRSKSDNATIYVDGIQVERKIGALNTPSPWTMPGVTSIDAGIIRTGQMQSTSMISVNGTNQPAWSINMSGNAQLGNALIRGKLLVGQSGADADAGQSYISSGNFVAGSTGWKIDSSGNAEFNNGVFRGSLGAQVVTSQNIQSGTISQNLILDPSFEDNYIIGVTSSATYDLWSIAPQTSGTYVAERNIRASDATNGARSGNKSLRLLAGNSTSRVSVLSNVIPVKPGEVYNATIWVGSWESTVATRLYFRIAGGSTKDLTEFNASTIALSIPFDGDDPTFAENYNIPVPAGKGNRRPFPSEFVPLSGQFTVPAGINYVSIFIYNYQPTAQSTIYVDDVTLTKQGSVASELTASGLRLIDGDGQEVVQLTSNGASTFSVSDATGTLAAIDSMGGATFQNVQITGADSDGDGVPDNGVEIYGRDFSDWYWNLPWGGVAGAYSADLVAGNVYQEFGIGEVSWVQLAGREYKLTFNGLLVYPAAATTRALIRIRYTNDGTAPRVGTSQIACSDYTTFTTVYPQLMGVMSAKGNWGPAGSTIRAMVTLAGVNNLNVAYDTRYSGGYNHPFRLWVEDIGPEVPDTFTPQNGGGVLGAPGGAASTPTAVKQTYVKTYSATSYATYKGSGTKRTDTTDVIQGYNSYNGDGKGLWIFPSMTSDLSGATVSKVEVYAYANHWYYNSGGTALLKVHGYTSAPAASPTLTTATSSSSWGVGGRWVTLPSSLYAGFQSGTYRGFGIGPAGSTSMLYYGRFTGSNAKIRVTYVK